MTRKKKTHGKVLFVQYCAKDFLDGVTLLTPVEELAYRRLCDLIYVSDDKVIDDDERLGSFTKAGDEWPTVRQTLIDMGKITLTEDGRLTNDRAKTELLRSKKAIKARAKGGETTAEKRRKALEDGNNSTQHPTERPTQHHGQHPTERPLTKNEERRTKNSKQEGAAPDGLNPNAIIAAFDAARVDVYGPERERAYPAATDTVTATRLIQMGFDVPTAHAMFQHAQQRQAEQGKAPIATLKYFEGHAQEFLAHKPQPLDDTRYGAPKPIKYAKKQTREELRQQRIDSFVRIKAKNWLFPADEEPPPTEQELQETYQRLGIEPEKGQP